MVAQTRGQRGAQTAGKAKGAGVGAVTRSHEQAFTSSSLSSSSSVSKSEDGESGKGSYWQDISEKGSESEKVSEKGSESEDVSDNEDGIDGLFTTSVRSCKGSDGPESASLLPSNFDTNADEVRLDDADEEKDKTKAKTTREVTAGQAKAIDHKGKSRALPDQLDLHFDSLTRGDGLGAQKPKSEARQKKDRQRAKEKTAGSEWYDLPAFPRASGGGKRAGGLKKGKRAVYARGPTAEEMTRQVQAIRLRNAMDPKQHYRGGNGTGDKAMPAFAQMGRIISSTSEPSSTMTRSERGRTVIDELVKDAKNAAYTKRKFSEQQVRTDVGRSSHVSRRKSNYAGKKLRR